MFFIAIILFDFICTLYSWNQQGFYEYNKADIDLWRLPLIKPYELNSSTIKDGWTVMYDMDMYFDNLELGSVKSFSVDSVSLNRNFILLYSNGVETYQGVIPAWFVFNTVTANGKYFRSRKEFESELRSNNIEQVKLYYVVDLFNKYHKDGTLPVEWQPYIKSDHNERWWDFMH